MRSTIQAFLVGTILVAWTCAQMPILKRGISVKMPVASHAIETPAADDQNAVVVAITANGKIFAGVEPTESAALSKLSEATVYVKADAQAPYQIVLSVLDALRGKSVVLLSAPPETAGTQRYVPPYGTRLTVSQ